MSEKHPGEIVVRGGEKSAPLPPARELDGTPDPEIARMVAEGAKKYHLDTLDALAADVREGERKLRSAAAEEDLKKASAHLQTVLAPALEDIARGLGLSSVPVLSFGDVSSGVAMQKLDEIERVRLENLGKEMARAVMGGKTEEDDPELGERLDAVLEKPCGAAACRTLKECLCTCKRCKMACARRRR